jgi:Protein of unknown function (DUF2891)
MYSSALDVATADRLANLALACVHREYPSKIGHSLNSDKDVLPPRELTPAFYGCYDWHSSVHGHWMLARLARTYPDAPLAVKAKQALRQSLTVENLQAEAKYLNGEGRASFERPYGLAWLLQLSMELQEWNDPDARQWGAALKPLEDAVVARLESWLKKLTFPVRSGEHSNTAFGLGLALDYARQTQNTELKALVETKARQFYLNDRACPFAYEPSGEDFLSPCLAEADVMRRVLTRAEFAKWLAGFIPGLVEASSGWLKPAVVADPTDGKLAHLDGLNLSRAWMLYGIVSALPESDPRVKLLQVTAGEHSRDGLKSVTGEHYEGGHWLGSFAVYLLTSRGIERASEADATLH